MLIFEYAKRYTIEPTSLINDAPNIWRWTNPNIAIADWMFSVYGIEYYTDSLNVYNFINAIVDNLLFIKVDAYESLSITTNSFYWDADAQIAYIRYDSNIHTTNSIYFEQAQGASYEVPYIMNGVLYPNILLNKPTISRTVEPVTIGKLATQSITIELRNDEICKIVDNVPTFYYRFDDIEDILGQETFVKYGNDLRIIHKGVIVNYTITPTVVKLDIDDVRAKNDAEWPIITYKDEGYTEYNIGEDKLSNIIPDGYGNQKYAPSICVDIDKHILQFDDETNELLNPPSNMISYDLTTWNKFDATVVKSDKKFGGFTLYTIQKTSGVTSARITKLFTATETIHRVSGYLMRGTQETVQIIGIYDTITMSSTNILSIDFVAKTYIAGTNTQNVRVKFIEEDNEPVAVYFSIEYYMFIIDRQFALLIYVDNSTTADTIGFVCGVKVTLAEYVPFRCAKVLTSVDKVYKKIEEEYIEIDTIDNDLENGIVYVHECDAHKDALLNNDLSEIVVDCVFRPETNPFDIIQSLTLNIFGIPYISSMYNISLCEAEKLKLTDISFYKDSPESFSQLIEELQNSSVINFRYEDIDKRYIMVDDPNRPVSFNITKDRVVNIYEQEIQGNMTLYADEVTINYATDRSTSDTLKYKNTSYQYDVLQRYRYKNHKEFDSYLTNETDAINKSIILLEDLSVTRRLHTIKYNGLDILDYIDLLSIVKVDLRISDDRPFANIIRAQIIGIDIDTEFDMITLTLRERVYSDIVAGIIGSGYRLIGTSTDRVLGVNVDRPLGYKED